MIYFDAVFRNFGKLVNHGHQGAGIQIVAANMDHIVGSSQDSALEPREGSAAGTRLWIDPYQIAGSVAKSGAAPTAQISQHQLSQGSWRNGLSRGWVDDLGNVFRFEYMDAGGVFRAFHADGADFRQAIVIENSGAPT